MIRTFAAAIVGLVCATWGIAHAADATPEQAPPAAATAPAATAPVADTANYIIGPGDTVQVFVWRNPELSVTVPVRPDGKISTPLVEDMVAVGKTPSQLARDIETSLSEYVRSPKVNILVSNAVGALGQIRVVGQVRTPQSIAYREGMTILDALLAVGGATDFAALDRTKLVRKAGNKTTEQRVKLGAVVNKGDLRYNVALQPGDVIVVPQALF
jgi:polysaccharide export outer membrane protein